ncbi:hypothetical protein [Nocardioides jishulii]|uniref:Uncharacterized protein n=1 Tax=Nocardioides jishulii TaxID=2575440 RepID=A0A4U2YSI5_9ACTN|nr:hypothetical protein [Nocardioides jishulii]QCX28689.1 hypothetical protein FCL41_14980 [Nocardioides jishulii]TKI64418.1 hypothetical protein FC770_04595 [Nocardioides jishulii]
MPPGVHTARYLFPDQGEEAALSSITELVDVGVVPVDVALECCSGVPEVEGSHPRLVADGEVLRIWRSHRGGQLDTLHAWQRRTICTFTFPHLRPDLVQLTVSGIDAEEGCRADAVRIAGFQVATGRGLTVRPRTSFVPERVVAETPGVDGTATFTYAGAPMEAFTVHLWDAHVGPRSAPALQRLSIGHFTVGVRRR